MVQNQMPKPIHALLSQLCLEPQAQSHCPSKQGFESGQSSLCKEAQHS